MALDPEQMRQRRLQRQQQRQQNQRKTVVKLVLAAIVLVISIVAVVLLTRPKQPAQTQTPSTSGQTAAPDTTPATEQAAPKTTVIHLAAAGDLNVTQSVVDAGGSEYDYTNAFLDVAHLLADADISVLNLEGNLFGAPYGADRSAPQNLAESLSVAGVDLVQLANSYSIYKGMDGLAATISGIRSAGMEPLGVYSDSAAAKAGKGYTIRNVSGVKIAFVAFTKGMDGMALPVGNDGCINLLYTDYATDYQEVDTEGISRILDAAAREKPDITVALLHWGSEFNDTISASQEQICSLMLEKGVDAIIGTHSHYVQKIVMDEAAGTFVAYSLGDFFGDASRAGSEYSVILDLEITKDHASGKTKITGYECTPIFTSAPKDKPARVLRIREAMRAFENNYLDRVTQAEYDSMSYALKRIDARLKGE